MLEPTGAFAAEIIEKLAKDASDQAEDRLRESMTTLLSERLHIPSEELPSSLVNLLMQPVSARQERVLVDTLQMLGGRSPILANTSALVFADEIADLSKAVRQSFRQKRNQASYIKTVLRPLHSLWLKRWRLEREDFDFQSVAGRSERLNAAYIANAVDLDQWARAVLDFFHDTAVEPEGTREMSKKPRGTVSEAGFRAYRQAWLTFIGENTHLILNELHNDPKNLSSRDPNRPLTSPMEVPNSTAMSFGQAPPTHSNAPMLNNFSMSSTSGNLPVNQIEVTLQSDDPAVPRVSRSWDLPTTNLVPQFQQWVQKLTPLLHLDSVPFNGAIIAKAPWGDQEVKLIDATAENIQTWGIMMIDV